MNYRVCISLDESLSTVWVLRMNLNGDYIFGQRGSQNVVYVVVIYQYPAEKAQPGTNVKYVEYHVYLSESLVLFLLVVLDGSLSRNLRVFFISIL